MTGPEYIGVTPHVERRKRDGHSLQKRYSDTGSHFRVTCSCGWFVIGLTATPDPSETAAYMHLTEPDLLITGTSDVMKGTRLARLKENSGDEE